MLRPTTTDLSNRTRYIANGFNSRSTRHLPNPMPITVLVFELYLATGFRSTAHWLTHRFSPRGAGMGMFGSYDIGSSTH